MPEKITTKPVTMLELFYDLIFAYAIGRMTQTLMHVDHGAIAWPVIGEFLMMILVFWTIWTYQTVLTNRFAHHDLVSACFMLFNMFWVIYLSTALNIDFSATKMAFQLSTAVLFASTGFQYWLIDHTHPNAVAKHLTRLLGLSAILAAVSVLPMITPYTVSFTIYLVSVLIAAFAPLALQKTLAQIPVHFGHLTERYGLLMLLIFGEAVVSFADTLHDGLSLGAVFFFIIIVMLFIAYLLVYDFGLDRQKQTAGLVAIHIHYPLIVAALTMPTVIALWLDHQLADLWFFALFWGALVLYFVSLFSYLQAYHTSLVDLSGKRWFYIGFTLLLAGLYLFITLPMPDLLLGGMAAYLLANCLYLWQFVLHAEP